MSNSPDAKIPAAAAVKAEPEIGEMKKGDYMIHVYLQQGKQIKGTNSESVCPMLEITCCDKKKYSSVKNDVGPTSTISWGEHIFFEPQNMSKSAIENAQIQIRVLNKGRLRDDLIGAYEFDLSFVYFQPKHALMHQWIALSNPESKEFNEISCYLKLSISVCGPGDEQVALNDESGPEKTDEAEIMMPASIKKEFKQVKFRFLKGEKFPKMDQFGTIDAYIQTVFFKKKLRTKAVTQTKNTHETPIEQEIWLPIQWPMASDRLVLKVFDEDQVNDEIVGSMYFSLKKIIKQTQNDGLLMWRNLYGSPLGCSGENTQKMNDNPEYASTWKGRMLMHISSYDVKNPEMKDKVPLDQEFKAMALKQGAYEYNDFELIAEIGTGICLPGKKKYTIRIAINDFVVESQAPKEMKENYCRWSERIEPKTFSAPYKSIEELDRVYVYLMDGNEPICFWKGQATEFSDPNPKKYRWLPLMADLAKGKVTKQYEAGMISLKLTINHKAKNGAMDFKRADSIWKKPPPKRLKSWKIRCFIFQCKDIPAADSDGTSDPYISLWNQDNKKIQTQVIEDNINPIFFEALELYYDYDNIESDAPPVVFNIWDRDEDILDTDDYLGRCVVFLNDAAVSNDDTIPEPRWHDIKIGFQDRDPACGQMLCSFSIVEDDYVYKIPINYLKLTEQIEYKEYNVEINVLGLRELESFGLMPIKKAFIKFNLRSLLPPEKAQAVTNIKTQPGAAGNSPNINTMINFTIDLPVNPLFCPKLSCDVYDFVYKGLVQPLIGTFTISIGDIMHQQNEFRAEVLQTSNNIIQMLKNRVKTMEESLMIKEESKEESKDYAEEEGKQMDFDKRVKGFNAMAESEFDSSRVGTEAMDKQKLIAEGPGSKTPPLVEEFSEEGKIESGSRASEKEIIRSGTKSGNGLSKSGTRTPLDFSPGKARHKQTVSGNIFKKEGKLQKDMEQGLNYKFAIQKALQKEEDKIHLAEQRIADKEMLKKEFEDAHKNVLLPRYEFDNRLKMMREISKPPASLYMEIGYNPTPPAAPEAEKKHYRKFYDDELENCKEIFEESPFYTVDVVRGQSRGLSSGFLSIFKAPKTDDSGEITNKKKVGKFKGRISITNSDEKDIFRALKESRLKIILSLINELHEKKHGTALDFQLSYLESSEQQNKFMGVLEDLGLKPGEIVSFLKEQSYWDLITRQLLTKTKCIVRLYVLEGYDFAQRDIGSFSDPYLKLKCGHKKYNERSNYQLDEPNPKFNKMYEFDVEFPGAPNLVIKAYDYDDLFGDDLIGTTVIDLDDRFFCPEWQQIENKPIEFRELTHPSSQCSQGVIKLWVEIHMTNSSTKSSERIWDVTPQPQQEYEVRLVIYDTVDVIPADFEGTSDVFIKGYIDDKDKRETDTHYRCMNGKASFNYRLLQTIKAPRRDYNLTLQVWDRDLFKSNDFMGETQLNLASLFEDVISTQKPMNLTKKYYNGYLKSKMPGVNIEFYDEDSFYVDCLDKNRKLIGKVRIGLNVTPAEMAKINPVGAGRTEPNHSPFLPPPVGRISFSLNPIAMFAYALRCVSH